ncbi:palmitoyltransferase ZDHHC18-B isoform X2 [Engraulis encrasicolus]|uniref:palmitoyltransferase ZDHHC18-B isoform X2 n=1 Tax=Engraulis encrasicolus TaxID=184585 RepID=UPI002FD52A97
MGRGKDARQDNDNPGVVAGNSNPQALPTPTPTPPSQPCPEKTRRQQRKWEVFPGKNRFYCDGRIIVARQSGVLPLTLGLILVTSGLFFIFDCPFLVKHLTCGIPVIGGVLFVFVVISLLQTSFTDPGILPRATAEEAADIEKQIDNTGSTSSSSYRPPPRTKEILINQQVVKLKYCFTCKIFRPPRTSHCSLCDNCVERFDHHCPWVGNCVGKRNYRFFYCFIVSLSFLTAFIFGCVTTHLALRSQDGNGLVYALQESPASALELVVCFFSVWSILGLSGFHTYLVASNLTTNEDIKGSWSGKSGSEDTGNPYSHNSMLGNCCSVLCGPMPPSLIDRRGYVSEDAVQCVSVDIQLPAAAKTDLNVANKLLLDPPSSSTSFTSSLTPSSLPKTKPSKPSTATAGTAKSSIKGSMKTKSPVNVKSKSPLKPADSFDSSGGDGDGDSSCPRPRTSSAPAPLAAPEDISAAMGPLSPDSPRPPIRPRQGSTGPTGRGGSNNASGRRSGGGTTNTGGSTGYAGGRTGGNHGGSGRHQGGSSSSKQMSSPSKPCSPAAKRQTSTGAVGRGGGPGGGSGSSGSNGGSPNEEGGNNNGGNGNISSPANKHRVASSGGSGSGGGGGGGGGVTNSSSNNSGIANTSSPADKRRVSRVSSNSGGGAVTNSSSNNSGIANTSSPADKRRHHHHRSAKRTNSAHSSHAHSSQTHSHHSHTHTHNHTHNHGNGHAHKPSNGAPALPAAAGPQQATLAPSPSPTTSTPTEGRKRSSSGSGHRSRENREGKLISQH